jgi:hypothetical protein
MNATHRFSRSSRFVRLAALFLVFAVLLAHFGCRDAPRGPSRTINGISARFEIKTPRLHIGESLKATAIYKNETDAPVAFRYLPPLFDAQIWRGPVEELPCTTPEMPYMEVVLKPGQEHIVDDELQLDRMCNKPGQHEVRFSYKLSLLADQKLAQEYKRKYTTANEAIAWEDRGHPFTVLE